MTDATLPLVPDDVADAALHGSFCPKMCTFACPVTEATGRDDAVPWSFHRTVSDLARDRAHPDAHAATHLEACTGCLACREPCVFDQDVPAQVRAGRAAVRSAGSPVAGAEAAVAAVADGRSPYGIALPAGDAAPEGDTPDVVVVAGCRDDAGDLAALRRLLAAAGRHAVVVVPEGCCGGALTDLGASDEAWEAAERLAERLPAAPTVIATDPHCLPSLRAAVPEGPTITDVASALATLLDDGDLRLSGDGDLRLSGDGDPRLSGDGDGDGAAPARVTFHDPCLLARAEQVTAPPRRLLAAAGVEVVEPEGHGRATVCSGAGMAFELVAPADAAATAELRAGQLGATGVPTVTACAGARRRLEGAGVDVTDLATFLANRLPETPA